MQDVWKYLRAFTFVALGIVTFGMLFTHVGALEYSGSGYCTDGTHQFGYAQNDGTDVAAADRSRRIPVTAAGNDLCLIELSVPADGGRDGWWGDAERIQISGGTATATGWQLPHPYAWVAPLKMARALGENTLEAMGLIANLIGLFVFIGLAARELSEG